MTVTSYPPSSVAGRKAKEGDVAGVARPRPLRRTGLLAWGVASALLAAAWMTGSAGLALVGLCLATTAGLRRVLPWAVALVSAPLVLTLAATAVGLAASPLRPLSSSLVSVAIQLTVLGISLPAARTVMEPVHRPRRGAIALLAPLAAATIGLLQFVVDRLAASWGLMGTDIAEHVVLLGGVQEAGHLDYSHGGYPRGLHALLALVTAPQASAPRSIELLRSDIILFAAVVWLAFAAVLLGAHVVASRVAVAGSLTGGSVAAALLPWLLLGWASLQLSFVHMGAAPSLLAVLSMWALPLWAMSSRSAGRDALPRAVMVAAASGAVLGHLWQPLVIAPATGVVGMLIAGRMHRDRPRKSAVILSVALSAACAAVAAPALIGVVDAGGIGIAAIEGVIPHAPLAIVVLILALDVAALRRLPRVAAGAWLGGLVGLFAVFAVLLIGAHGDPSQYYPQKVVWFFCLVSAPLSATAAVHVLIRCARLLLMATRGHQRVMRVGISAIAVAGPLAVVVPGMFAPTSMLRASVIAEPADGYAGRRIEIAAQHADAYAPAVTVPVEAGLLPGGRGAYVQSKLIRFLTGQPTNFGYAGDVCADVRAVAGAHPAVVLTDVSPTDLRLNLNAGGCGDLRIVRADGAPSDYSRDLGRGLRSDSNNGS